MLKWNKYSIRRQLISVFIIVHVIFLLFLIFYYNYSLRQSYLGQVEDSLYHQALLIRENISADNFQFSNIDQWAREVGGKIEKRITIINRDGQVIADSVFSVEEMDNHLGRPEIQAVLTGERSGKDIRQSGTLNIDMYYLVVPVNNESFSGFIRLAESLEDIDAVLNTNIKNNISFFIIILILYLFLIWKITSNIINPLSQITDQVRKMANGNLQEEIRLRANANEIDTLARAFNFMAQQLKTKIEQVSAERNRAEAILTNMVDGLLVTDKNLMIKLVNPAARKMFSLQDKEFLGKSIIEVFRYHEIEDNFMKAMEENKLFTAELQIPGEPNKILKSNFVAINNERGQVIGALAVFSDITELRRLENLRKDFVANVSHELRTPLTSIIGYLDTILENEINELGTIKRFLNIIKKEADRLSLLIKGLLDLSKLESGGKHILRPAFLNRHIDNVMLLLEERAREKEIILEKNLESELMVYMIPEQIEQVLINLLENAIKYTPAGGKIKVRVYSAGDKAVVEVIDNGIGIPAAEQERIFERFYRVDKARSRALGGTGIGLSIVKHIIENHRNKIEVESEEGQGSTFRFYLDRVR